MMKEAESEKTAQTVECVVVVTKLVVFLAGGM